MKLRVKNIVVYGVFLTAKHLFYMGALLLFLTSVLFLIIWQGDFDVLFTQRYYIKLSESHIYPIASNTPYTRATEDGTNRTGGRPYLTATEKVYRFCWLNYH